MNQKPQNTCPYCYAEGRITSVGNALYACKTTFLYGKGYNKMCGEVEFVPRCASEGQSGCKTCAMFDRYEGVPKYCQTCFSKGCSSAKEATPEQCRKCYWVLPAERR